MQPAWVSRWSDRLCAAALAPIGGFFHRRQDPEINFWGLRPLAHPGNPPVPFQGCPQPSSAYASCRPVDPRLSRRTVLKAWHDRFPRYQGLWSFFRIRVFLPFLNDAVGDKIIHREFLTCKDNSKSLNYIYLHDHLQQICAAHPAPRSGQHGGADHGQDRSSCR